MASVNFSPKLPNVPMIFLNIYLWLTVVDTIQGDFGFLEAQKTSKEKIFIWRKQARRKLSCDVVHLFIALVIIEISFDLYLSIGSESIETQMYTFVLPTHVIFLPLSTG